MANDGAAGSTLTWAGTTQAVSSISYADNGNPVDVTTLSDTTHQYVIGIRDPECTVETVGISSVTVGATGALSIAWFDGDSASIASAVCTSADSSGEIDGALSSSLTFKPYGG